MTLAPAKLWLAFFALWSVVLTGVFADTIGAPGGWQAWKLRELLNTKQGQLGELRGHVRRLESQIQLLEKHRTTQVREVRRVLGYAAPEELVFEFDSPLP